MTKPVEEVMDCTERRPAREFRVPECLGVCEVKELIKENTFVRMRWESTANDKQAVTSQVASCQPNVIQEREWNHHKRKTQNRYWNQKTNW